MGVTPLLFRRLHLQEKLSEFGGASYKGNNVGSARFLVQTSDGGSRRPLAVACRGAGIPELRERGLRVKESDARHSRFAAVGSRG